MLLKILNLNKYIKNRRSGMDIKYVIRSALFQVFFVVILNLLANQSLAQWTKFITQVPIIIIALASLLLGTFLYWLRCHHRINYGVGEVVFGVLSVCTTWSAIKINPSALDYFASLPIIAGLYVVVRGLDNVGNGLKEHNIKNKWWDKFFRIENNKNSTEA